MARLDLGGLRDLWYRIDDIFARLTEAAGSIALSGTSLVLSAVSGGTLSTIDLDGTFATDAEAGHSLALDANTLRLRNVGGTNLSSINLANQFATRDNAASKLKLSDSSLILESVNGDTRSTVNLSNLLSQAVNSGIAGSGLITLATADDRYVASVRASGNTLYFLSKDGTTLSTVTIS